MKNTVIIGCGKGIGLATAQLLSEKQNIIGISRSSSPELQNLNIKFHEMDVISGNLDNIDFPEVIDGLVYAPGTINLKPFNRLMILRMILRMILKLMFLERLSAFRNSSRILKNQEIHRLFSTAL